MRRQQSADNLRGRRVTFVYDGRILTGVVITRIRGTRWLIESAQLPVSCKCGGSGVRRVTLDRSKFTLQPSITVHWDDLLEQWRDMSVSSDELIPTHWMPLSDPPGTNKLNIAPPPDIGGMAKKSLSASRAEMGVFLILMLALVILAAVLLVLRS